MKQEYTGRDEVGNEGGEGWRWSSSRETDRRLPLTLIGQ